MVNLEKLHLLFNLPTMFLSISVSVELKSNEDYRFQLQLRSSSITAKFCHHEVSLPYLVLKPVIRLSSRRRIYAKKKPHISISLLQKPKFSILEAMVLLIKTNQKEKK